MGRERNVALIGCGGWGKNLARNLDQLGALAAVVDPSPGAADLAAEMGVPIRPIEDVLGDRAITAVAIAVPAFAHAEVAEAALRADKDVFVEKPIALELKDAARLAAVAGESGRILMVGHLLQYHPVFMALLERVESGALGRVRHIVSNRFNLGVVRTYENVMWSFAPHDISMVLALTGTMPSSVTARGITVLQPGVPDITTVHLQFDGGAGATISSSWLHPQKEQKLIVVGDDGMAVFDDRKVWGEKLAIHHNRVEWTGETPKAIAGQVELVEVPEGEPLRNEMSHFLAVIENRDRPRTDAAEAIGVLRVLAAAQMSLEEGGRHMQIDGPDTDPIGSDDDIRVHETAVVDPGVVIGRGTRIWHFSHVLSGSRLGARCVVGQNVMIGPEVTIGDGCKIQNNVAVYKGVTLEDDVFCGPSMVFTNVLTPRAHVERKQEFAPTLVGRGATLGANCTIICGNRIGRYAMVGAGAVVTRDVPDHAIVVGNPARQIGWASEAGERLGDDLVCPRTGQGYEVVEGVRPGLRHKA